MSDDDLKLPAGLPEELRERIGGLQSHWCWPTLAAVLERLQVEQELTALLQAECRAWRAKADAQARYDAAWLACKMRWTLLDQMNPENECHTADAGARAARSAVDEAGALGDG